MEKNIENFINYSKVELTMTSILKDILLFSSWILIGGVLSFRLKVFLIVGFIYMGTIGIMGFYYMKKKCKWGMSMYSGLYGIGSAAALFSISYASLKLLTGGSIWVLFMYIIVFIFCCVCFILNIWNRIKKDVYAQNGGKPNPIFAYLGSGAALLLAPVIFSNFNNNQAFTFLAFVFLFIGVIYTMSSYLLLTAYMQKKYS